jgi:hypothetical protein
MHQQTYRLSNQQAKCLSYTYSQLSGTTATVDVKRFKDMGKVVKLAKSGANGTTLYDEAEMLAKLSEGGKIRESDAPGDVTRVYMGLRGEGYNETKTNQVRKLQECISRLTKNYKDRQMFSNIAMATKSQNLEDSVQLLQQGIVDGSKNEADVAAKEAEVREFVQGVTSSQQTARKKKGGRKTLRKGRKGA